MQQSSFLSALAGACLLAAGPVMLPMGQARADDALLGLYVGAAAGQGRVKASPGSLVATKAGESTLVRCG